MNTMSTSTSMQIHSLSQEDTVKESNHDKNNNFETEEESETGPTNEYVLNFAFISFMAFVVVEYVFAIIAKSESMMADAQAMAVDAFTYLFNLMAERQKRKLFDNEDSTDQKSEKTKNRQLLDNKIYMIYLELIPPSISVVVLVAVSVQAFCDAMDKLFNKEFVPKSEQSNVLLMFAFSGTNLLIDILNMLYFSKLKNFTKSLSNLFGFNGENQDRAHNGVTESSDFDKNKKKIKFAVNHDENIRLLDPEKSSNTYDDELKVKSLTMNRLSGDEESMQNSEYNNETCETTSSNDSKNLLNLNMCSAYTHVMADTLRSITVLLTSSMALCFQQINGDTADAIGAITVSFIIAISLGPLLVGIASTWSDLRLHLGLRSKLAT